MNLINSALPDQSLIGNIVKEARMKMDFSICTVRHAKREANKVAHVLACQAIHLVEELGWFDILPEVIRPIIFI